MELDLHLGGNQFRVTGVDAQANPVPGASSTIEVHLAPFSLTITRRENEIALTIDTVSNETYRLGYKDRLEELEWKLLGDEFIASSSQATVLDTVPLDTQRFYRVAVVAGAPRSLSTGSGQAFSAQHEIKPPSH